MKSRLRPEDYITGILSGDSALLSKAITLIESRNAESNEVASQVLDGVMPHTGKSLRLGITGAPGVGKSTFINRFGEIVLSKYQKLAVLAIDPSSVKTRGSIMGDKTRMAELLNSPNVFVRPTPAGSTLGGVGWKTRETMLLCEAAGYDFIIIETVGVGQSEVAVKDMVDFLLLLLSPTGGDELQGMKKGIVELSNGIAITKSDGNNLSAANQAKKEYSSAIRLISSSEMDESIKVLTCSALENKGFHEILENIISTVNLKRKSGQLEAMRSDQLVAWMHQEISDRLVNNFYRNKEKQQLIKDLEQQVRQRLLSPQTAISKMLGSI